MWHYSHKSDVSGQTVWVRGRAFTDLVDSDDDSNDVFSLGQVKGPFDESGHFDLA